MLYEQNNSWTVTELNDYVRDLLEAAPLLSDIRLTGEIADFKHHSSGHLYFTLKDAQSRVSAVMWRSGAAMLSFEPKNGMLVTVRARASLYSKSGAYQLYVSSMRRAGLGDMYLRFEQLKRKLEAEGLLSSERKRPIPSHPRILGVVTSRSGAAFHDIVRVARARDPKIGILLAPCAVQGVGAAEEIARAIRLLNRNGEADVLLVGRGGGSAEDLWAFNEEPVARAIAASTIPVISCVGHEIDFSIADLVADLRAATPSNAAELAVPDKEEAALAERRLEQRLLRALATGQKIRRSALERFAASPVLRKPELLISERRTRTETARTKLISAQEHRIAMLYLRHDELSRTLNAVAPMQVLKRGYAAVRRDGAFVNRAEELETGNRVDLVFADGSRKAEIREEE